ncbi:CHAT domain-containing protein [Cellulomonas sp. CW35]|uniref:CHAT domain-containing protein n=1 Tax=unclassified Cellulomonas TaxID=2620175 RepID=UPI000A73D380|nr:CHAT domain-containing protein [Cellulomonas sp. PSBB021]ASR55308.1 CHAT domain-containing protein [Cellulomonas sp. PSBB021]
MTERSGPAAAGPLPDGDARRAALERVAVDVALAEADNAEGHPNQARRRLVAALGRLDRLAGDDELTDPVRVRVRARALMELAKCEFETRGGPQAALAQLDGLVAAGAADAWPGIVPAAAGVRGLLALRGGRQDEALVALDAAIEQLDVADPVDGCRALLNRGTLHSERRDTAAARADYSQCAVRARAAGFDLLVFKAEHNLGYVHFREGRLPEALATMEAAARSLPGPVRPTALRDRSEVLLEAGLVGVADATLAQAAQMFADERLPREVAECELGRAECALLRGDPVAARRWASSARRRFARRGDEAWVVRSSLLELQADAGVLARRPDGRASRSGWAGVARRAAEVEELCRTTGRPAWQRAASYLRIEADLARGVGPDPERVLDGLGTVRADEPLTLRLHGRRIRALLAAAAGRPDRATHHVRAGQRDLAMHRSRFGSLDLRTAGAVHGTALAELDMRLALATGHPERVLESAERVRAVMGGAPRVNPPSDPRTAELLAQLRRLVEGSRPVTGRPAADPERRKLIADAQRLKLEILARSWHEPGRSARDEREGRAHEVRAVLARRPQTLLLDVIDHEGRLLAVSMGVEGAELADLGEAAPAAELVRRVHADLEVVANPLVPAELRAVADRSLRGALERLDAVVRPVLDRADELVVVAGGWLGVLPWSMLPSRRGAPTVVAPSVHHWMRYAGAGLPEAPLTAAAGPGLVHAADEARHVATLWPGARVLVDDDASVANVAEALASPGVVHLAAHGRHEPDNPLFSSLRLADGPLFAHELDAGGQVPDLVLLSSCEVGRATIRAGGEALGLASVLLRTGVPCVVAAIAPLPDETAMHVMSGVHERMRAGMPVAAAVAQACADHDRGGGGLVPLVCLGAPV